MALARVCRAAGAWVPCGALIRDMNVGVTAGGPPCFHGASLAVDTTVRSFVTADGGARSGAATADGATFIGARADKERNYAELVQARRCRLVAVAIETGGRWSDEAADFVLLLAEGRSREVPPNICKQGMAALVDADARLCGVSGGTSGGVGGIACRRRDANTCGCPGRGCARLTRGSDVAYVITFVVVESIILLTVM